MDEEELRLIELLLLLLLDPRLMLLEEGRLELVDAGLLVEDCGLTYSVLERDGRLLVLGRAVALVVPVLGRTVLVLGLVVLVLGRELTVGLELTVGRALVPLVVGRTVAPEPVLPLTLAPPFLGLLF